MIHKHESQIPGFQNPRTPKTEKKIKNTVRGFGIRGFVRPPAAPQKCLSDFPHKKYHGGGPKPLILFWP